MGMQFVHGPPGVLQAFLVVQSGLAIKLLAWAILVLQAFLAGQSGLAGALPSAVAGAQIPPVGPLTARQVGRDGIRELGCPAMQPHCICTSIPHKVDVCRKRLVGKAGLVFAMPGTTYYASRELPMRLTAQSIIQCPTAQLPNRSLPTAKVQTAALSPLPK